MDKIKRGEIHTRARACQLLDFSGLQYGKITPTDIDGMIEFGNSLFVIIEMKHIGIEMPLGQRVALERLVDNITKSGRVCICLVAEHDTTADEDVYVADCVVHTYRYNGAWRNPLASTTVREAIDAILGEYPILRHYLD